LPSRHRGPLAIHASKSRRHVAGDCSGVQPDLPPVEELPSGALVGVFQGLGFVPLVEVDGDPFAVGPWCWVLSGARCCRPVP